VSNETPPAPSSSPNTALVGILAVVAGAGFLYYFPANRNLAMDKLTIAIGYALLILIFLFGLIVLLKMATGEIDLRLLLAEDGGNGASMSRFQLLVFTLVIAMSFFLIVAHTQQFPTMSAEVLTLLGISATTYGVSKGIQASSGQTKGDPTPTAASPPVTPRENPQAAPAAAPGQDNAAG
jgi:hypothetical protein